MNSKPCTLKTYVNTYVNTLSSAIRQLTQKPITIRPEVQKLIKDAKSFNGVTCKRILPNFKELLQRAAELLRPPAGKTLLTLREVDALEQAFAEGNDYSTVYGQMPALGPGVHVAISAEECTALTQYFELLGAKNVVEVGAGDGRLTSALHERLTSQGIRIIASDPGVGKISAGSNVLPLSASETLQHNNPDVIIVSWPDPSTTLDLDMAKYIYEHPNITLIIIGAGEDTGSHQFYAQVMGKHRYNPNHLCPEIEELPPEITIPLQHQYPKGLNEIIAGDGNRYQLNRSRRKSYDGGDTGYILVLRSTKSEPIPEGTTIRTDYLPPARYKSMVV